MIKARFLIDGGGAVFGYDISNHGDPVVCAAVSALTVNCANSIEKFTKARVEGASKSGHFRLNLPGARAGERDADCALLIKSLRLGLETIAAEYPGEIRVYDVYKKRGNDNNV